MAAIHYTRNSMLLDGIIRGNTFSEICFLIGVNELNSLFK